MSTERPPADDMPSATALSPNTTPAPAATTSPTNTHGTTSLVQSATEPQLTLRALLSGMLLGGLLSVCNIYAGLKLGLVVNMSIVAALLSYGLWTPVARLSFGRLRSWGILENNITQTATSAGASVASAGLISAIPTLTIMTGHALPWPALALWVLSVCLVGIVLAAGLRRPLLLADRLPFPSGVATAETLREMYARGRQAVSGVLALLSAGTLAGVVTWSKQHFAVGSLAMPGSVSGIRLHALGFAVSPSPLLPAIGGLIGPRACASLLLGSVVAFGLIAPGLLQAKTVTQPTHSELVKWLLWPGVTLMVVSALAGLAFSWRAVQAALRGIAAGGSESASGATRWPLRRLFFWGVAGVVALSVLLQVILFGITLWAALVGVGLSLALAVVAARVGGETGMNPVAAVGKVTQVSLAALLPQTPAANLATANVTAGAASQCADLLDDLKCGHLLGADPTRQVMAQVCGALAGALVGSGAYLLLIPEPSTQLPSSEWPAPGVVGMRAVAELFQRGGSVLPDGAAMAMWLAGLTGLLLTLLERLGPRAIRRWVPSAASIGLAFILTPETALTIFLGGMAALGLRTVWPGWTQRYLVTICAGLVAGDTLTGTGLLVRRLWPV